MDIPAADKSPRGVFLTACFPREVIAPVLRPSQPPALLAAPNSAGDAGHADIDRLRYREEHDTRIFDSPRDAGTAATLLAFAVNSSWQPVSTYLTSRCKSYCAGPIKPL
jgi:hypothetical protein